jgi:hypothetical protein
MLEAESWLCRPDLPFSNRDSSVSLSGWKLIGKAGPRSPIVDCQTCIAPGQAAKVRGVMHLADTGTDGQRGDPAVRLLVGFLLGAERPSPMR